MAARFRRQLSHWIDIGCGAGYLLAEAKRSGYEARGVEPDRGAREIAQTINPEVSIVEELESLAARKAGVVSMLDVLEHVPCQRLEETARSIHRLLAASGVWILKVPSSDGPYFTIAHLVSRFTPRLVKPFIERLWQLKYQSPHYVYFNERSARGFLERHGFAVVSVTQFPADPDSFRARSAHARRHRAALESALRFAGDRVLNAYEKLAGRTDSMVVVARRLNLSLPGKVM